MKPVTATASSLIYVPMHCDTTPRAAACTWLTSCVHLPSRRLAVSYARVPAAVQGRLGSTVRDSAEDACDEDACDEDACDVSESVSE